MPRKRRVCPPGLPVHVVQRGNNRQACFADEADLKAYAHWLRVAADKYSVAIHAWVFMTNHVHLLVTPSSAHGISRCMQYLGRHYVRRFNDRYQRTGTLFEGRFRSGIVQSHRYLLICQRYIELNPVRAGMVRDPADYTWSSYRAHAFGKLVGLWSPHPEYLALGDTPGRRGAAYREFFQGALAETLIDDIRAAVNQGLVLGSDRFKTEVEQLTGQSQRPLKRGPAARR
ncbi:MAG: transposase [Gammaproteobacteria bacterium]|jgi:putative transposase|nr:transposase [Gammaproteobacteria bacterium]